MAITYTWAVTGMRITNAGSLTDYVVNVRWTKTGTDEHGNTGTFNGATPLEVDEAHANFMPYEQLTQETVLSWIQPVVVGAYEAHVNDMIAKQIAEKATPIRDGELAWAPTTTPTPAPAA